jgi:hypothetical protein
MNKDGAKYLTMLNDNYFSFFPEQSWTITNLRINVGISRNALKKNLKNALPGNLMQAICAGLSMEPNAMVKLIIHGKIKWKNAEPAKCLTIFLKQKKGFKANG